MYTYLLCHKHERGETAKTAAAKYYISNTTYTLS